MRRPTVSWRQALAPGRRLDDQACAGVLQQPLQIGRRAQDRRRRGAEAVDGLRGQDERRRQVVQVFEFRLTARRLIRREGGAPEKALIRLPVPLQTESALRSRYGLRKNQIVDTISGLLEATD